MLQLIVFLSGDDSKCHCVRMPCCADWMSTTPVPVNTRVFTCHVCLCRMSACNILSTCRTPPSASLSSRARLFQRPETPACDVIQSSLGIQPDSRKPASPSRTFGTRGSIRIKPSPSPLTYRVEKAAVQPIVNGFGTDSRFGDDLRSPQTPLGGQHNENPRLEPLPGKKGNNLI